MSILEIILYSCLAASVAIYLTIQIVKTVKAKKDQKQAKEQKEILENDTTKN